MNFFNNRVITQLMPTAIAETLGMVGLSAIATVLLGLPLGLWLYSTGPGGLKPNAWIYRTLGVIVNIGRSIPFLILMIAIIPLTRALAGTSLGWQAAAVPLSVGAIPFFARLVESSVREVDSGKIEASRVMGAGAWRITRTVLLREGLPGLISATTVTVITLISYSAMAGVIGGGGLGALAINYGYQRFQADVMIVTVVVIVVIVQAVQMLGDFASRRVDHR